MYGEGPATTEIDTTSDVFWFLNGFHTEPDCSSTLKMHLEYLRNDAVDTAKAYTDDVSIRLADLSLYTRNELKNYIDKQDKKINDTLEDLSSYTRNELKEYLEK